ncbi:lamin tail domain-containing protein [Deinococcus sp. RM]|uniref:lamin tail domain-containing protein n=1 Tax=Deinococcus sp. RM TaxID=2316359 RepID=UPI000E68AB10|nr:lamin tail domain-containing protein [Deinococcus sp. RM]RIY08673.1 ABC transporter [Deinococcus sp. RM]
MFNSTFRRGFVLLASVSLALSSCGRTPAASGTPLSALAAAGEPVINELYYDSPSTDVGTFIELRGPAGASLSGYTLAAFDTAGTQYRTISLSGTIPASGYFVVAQDTTVASRNLVNAGADLNNGAGSLRLLKSTTIIDAVAYGSPTSNKGEGTPAATTGAGSALARVPDGSDTNANSVDFKVQAATAGAANGGGTGGGGTTGKKILFDLTKAEDAGNADWRIDGAYSDYANALRALGYTVNSVTGTSITSTSLSGASVLVIPEPQNPFSDSERAAIQSFVQSGGGLFMITDHRVSDRNNSGWDSPEVFDGWDGSTPSSVSSAYQSSLNSDVIFGLNASFNSSFSDPVLSATPLTTHPILNGVSSAGVYVGTSVDVLAGTALMGTGGKTYLAVSSVGSGRVAMWGDSSTFGDNTYSDGSTGTYNNWPNLSNATMGKNIVRWLAKDL